MGLQFVVTYHVEEHEGRAPAVTYAEVFEQIALAERVGFDVLWLAEHHFEVQAGAVSQPLLVALAVADRTERIAVGTSLIVLPLHHPLTLAEQLATLEVLTGGRLSIGVGSGSAPVEFEGFGATFTPRERHARFRESLELLEVTWRGEHFSFNGEFFQVPDVRLAPRPERPLRDFLWLGAMSPATAATAGEFGYGLQLPRGRAGADFAEVLGAYRAARCEAGHSREDERVAIARMIYVGADDEAALAEAGPSITRFYTQSKQYVAGDPVPSVPEIIARQHLIVGGPETCARQIAELHEVTGLTHLSVQPTWVGLSHEHAMASIRRFGEAIIPRLR